MAVISARSVYAPGREPPKSEIIQLLEAIAGGTAGIGDFRGAWAAPTQYVAKDYVESGGNIWYAKRDNIGVTPVEGADWTLLLPGNTPADGSVGAAQIDDADVPAIQELLGISKSTRRQAAVLTMPSGFDWPKNAGSSVGLRPFAIRRLVSGQYLCDYVSQFPASLISNGGSTTTRYVAATGQGNDANDGLTPQTPVQTIDAAFAKSAGVRRVVLQPGDHVLSWGSTPVPTQCVIECPEGKARLIRGTIPSSFSSAGSGIYTTTTASVVTTVVNNRQSDELGFPLALPKRTSLFDLQATAGPGWAQDSGTVYMRLRDDGAGVPAPEVGAIVLCLEGQGPIVSAGSRYLVRNVEFWGGNSAFEINTSSTSSTAHLVFENCDFAYARNNGLRAYNARGGVVSINCRAFRNALDGFNYHDDLVNSSIAIEVNCLGLGNGRDAPDNTHNGSTNHDTGRIVRVGGLYGSGPGPSVADVGDSQSWNVGCAAFDGRASVNPMSWYAGDGNTKMWLDDCLGYGSPTAIRAINGGYVYLRDFIGEGSVVADVGGTIDQY